MRRIVLVTLGGLLVALAGVLHGYWSHRWTGWAETDAESVRAQLEAVPLRVGDWVGERVPNDTLNLSEELVGLGGVTKYVDQVDGSVVHFYLAYGPTESIVAHTPPVCYQANGYTWLRPDLRQSVGPTEGGELAFWVSQFSGGDASAADPVHLRVFWSYWADGRWQVPSNPGRAFRHAPATYKCYAIRQTRGVAEPTVGDPCVRLLDLLLPKIEAILEPPTP